MTTHDHDNRALGIQGNRASNGWAEGNTAAIATRAATYQSADPWADRPPVSHGFAAPKRRILRPAGVGYGTADPTLRRERSFSHPDFDRPGPVSESAFRFPSRPR
jgi:hypothetical protein